MRVPISRLAGIVMCLLGGLFVLFSVDAARWQAPPTTSSYHYPGYSFSTTAPLFGWDDLRLRRGADETPVEFAARANQVIFSAVYHCRDMSGSTWASQRLGALGLFGFAEHGVLSPRYLRCGFCNQVSYILSRVLRENGIDAFVYGLNGHVVTVFLEGNSQFIADPDYGIGPWEVNISSPVSMSQLAPAKYAWLTDRFGLSGARHYKSVTDAYGTTEDDVEYMSSGGAEVLYHRTVYNFDDLKALLEACGFGRVRRYDWRQTLPKDYGDFSQAYVPHMDKEKGLLISLNVEADKI